MRNLVSTVGQKLVDGARLIAALGRRLPLPPAQTASSVCSDPRPAEVLLRHVELVLRSFDQVEVADQSES